jgi:uncharacterized protein YaiI (UPF0178 family)/uncharacterized coiled-coil protein SlyX
MASLTRSQLKTASNSTYDTNGVGGITAAEARTFNNDLIDSLITNDLTSSMVVLSASFATSASSVNGQTLTSLNQFTASQDTKNLTLASYTGSNDTTNTTQNNRLSNLESKSASVDISISNINQFTASNGNASLNQFTSSADNRLNNLESTSASVNISISNLNSTTASQAISISNLNAATSSYAISSSVAAVDAAQQSQIDSLIAASGSYITSSTPLNSLNAFTQSQYVSNSFFATTGSNQFNGNQTITGSFVVYNGAFSNRLSIPNNSNAIVFNVDRPIEVTGAGGTSGVGFQFSGTNPRLIFTDTGTGYATNIYNSVNDFYVAQANGKFISFPNIATPTTIIYNKLNVSGSVSITGSLTASIQQGYAWVGNANGISVAVATSSFAGGASTDITALNAFTASQDTKNTTLANVTASLQSQLTNIGSQSGSWVTETESGSFLITASVNLNTITFSKGDNTTFAITVNTGSAATTDITSLNAFTASQDTKNSTLATYTASVDQKFSNIGSQSGSWITESETASFARTNVDNNFTANQTFTNITAVSASFQYVQTTYETSSVIYSSGSNQLGDELTDIQTLSGSVKVQGSLTVNGIPVQTSSVDITSLNQFTASQETKNSTLASYTASVNSQLSSLTNATASYAISSSVAAVDAGQQSQINNLIAWTSSVVPTNISSLNSFTASQETKNSTLATYTASVDSSLTNINSFTASNGNTSLNSYTSSNDTKWSNLAGQTGSYVTSAITASSLVTASVSLNTITFTKGDTSTFNITVDTGSAAAATTIFEVVFTGENITKGDPLYISGSQGANPRVFIADAADPNKMPVTFISNETIGVSNTTNAIILGLIEGIDLTGYTAGQSIYVAEGGGWSTSLPSGSNSITQLLGVVTKGGSGGKGLVLNPGPALLPGLDTGKMWVGNGNNQPTEITTASFASSASFNSYTASNDQKVNSLINATASYVTSAITASSLITASVNLNTITFTKGDASTFNITVNTGSGGSTINTGSFATTGSNSFVGDQFLLNSRSLYVSNDTPQQLKFGSSDNGQAFDMRVTGSGVEQQTWLIENQGGIWGNSFFNRMYVDSNLNVNSTFTASLQEGYVWVGNSIGKTSTVATSSFGGGLPSGLLSSSVTNFVDYSASVDARILAITGSGGTINTGSFATTGSNTFTGDQTLIDAAGNSVTLTDTSGSLMLVAKSYTSASAHLSSSVNQVNLIFKNNNNTADTIISGSNNIFVNPAAPTTGFKRYVGTTGNIALNASNVPLISGSMAFSPTVTTNYFGGNAATLTMRGPVSSSTWTIAGNNILGAINIGSSAANNAEKAVAGMFITTNSINGTLSFIANRSILTQNSQIINNVITSATLTAASSSILYSNNIGNIVVTNSVSGSATSVSIGSNAIQINANNFTGVGNTITATGSADPGDTSGASYLRHFESNAMFGSQNGVNLPNAATGSNSLSATLIAGYGLGVTGSNASSLTTLTGTNNGSAFFGRWNALDGNRAQSAQTIFAVGTGTSTSNRKTGFLIDSGSNTFVEGTFNVSGSSIFNGNATFTGSVNITGSLLVNGTTISTVGFATTGSNSFNGNQRITGSLTMSGSIITVDRSGNDGNVYMGLNALGMGNAGAQPLAVGNSISVAIGIGAMRFASGSNQNVAIGNNALLITSGSKNFAMGSEAMSSNTTGANNVAIGTSALQNNTTGDSSTAIGDSAAQFASGSQNTFIGQYSGYNVTGSNNVIIGSYRGVAGEVISNNIILSDGQQNVRAQYSGSAWSFQDNIKFNKGTNKTTDIVSVNGSVTVNNSLVTGGSIILLTTQNGDVAGTMYPAVVMNKGTGAFDIVHDYGGTLQVAYLIINPT